ncbi:hypothetical protein [Polymorphospora rubra]|uniref:hypothetical protein n=1 Tax=Polymorphospora rubra TaxID=338584 RepID=UPI003F4D61EC
MREMQDWLVTGGPPEPERVVAPDSTSRVLLTVAARALSGRDCADLTYLPLLTRFRGAPEPVRRAAIARAGARSALAPSEVAEVDVEAVGRWIVDHYPRHDYPGVVIGSPHGAAVHLATALGVPWLPAAFEIAVQWPGGAVDEPARALAHGSRVAPGLLAANPAAVVVRQVHDPAGRGVLAGATITLVVRWARLPDAYRAFLRDRLAPGTPVLILRDARTWPVLDAGGGHTFQIGSPGSGLDAGELRCDSDLFDRVLRAVGGDGTRWDAPTPSCPDAYAEHGIDPGLETSLRDWLAGAGRPLHRVLFTRPEALSAATADVYREWLRAAGKTGDRAVVECGRQLDPWQVVRAGLVPYWCESATRRSVAGAELWLAGSSAFSSVDVLPDPPGMASPVLAGLPQWRAAASFGRRRGAVDRLAARGYPTSAVPTGHATEVLRNQPYDLPAPKPLRIVDALTGLRDSGTQQGLLIC